MHRIPPRIVRENHCFIPVYPLLSGEFLLIPYYYGGQDIDSGIGTETSETTRLNRVFRSPLHGEFTLKSYRIVCNFLRKYTDTVSTSYHYRMYVRPVQIADDGTVTDLDVERSLIAFDCGAAASAGWVNQVWYSRIEVYRLNIPIKGWLGFRLRTTSWADAPANSGHG